MKERILLVEDADDVRTTLKSLLEERYEVVEAWDAERALQLSREHGPFPVVVTDQGMPGITGIELLRRLHADHPESIGVLLTGAYSPEQLVHAVQEGHVFRFLPKPTSDELLLRAVAEALEHHREVESTRLGEEELAFVRDSLGSLNELLEERIAQQTGVLERLHRFAVRLSAADTLGEIATVAAHAASELFGGRGTHVQIWSASGVAIEASAGPEMSAHLHDEPLLGPHGTLGEITVDLGVHPELALPQREAHALNSIASSTAIAVRNQLRRLQHDHAQQAMIMALAHLAEQRDQGTGRHLERVAAYCELLGRGLREQGHYAEWIDTAFIENLVRSSPLHDIGKVGIPDAILLKPARLSEGEWQVMRTHAELGAQTIESVMRDFPDQGFLEMGRDIARCHHEHWDGSGYPQGLKGEAIPLAARILALADVYDALTTARPYKQAWTHAQALEWIVGQSGRHFDPALVDCFVKHAEQADAIRARLADPHEPALRKPRDEGERR